MGHSQSLFCARPKNALAAAQFFSSAENPRTDGQRKERLNGTPGIQSTFVWKKGSERNLAEERDSRGKAPHFGPEGRFCPLMNK